MGWVKLGEVRELVLTKVVLHGLAFFCFYNCFHHNTHIATCNS